MTNNEKNSRKKDIPQLLNQIISAIKNKKILSPLIFFTLNIDNVLNKRDNKEFEATILPLFEKTKKMRQDRSKKELEYIEDFNQEIFNHVFYYTKSDDLAAYIADDFTLLAEALHFNLENGCFNALAASYLNNQIPHDPLIPIDGNIYDYMKKIAKKGIIKIENQEEETFISKIFTPTNIILAILFLPLLIAIIYGLIKII
jgi:hypothetical protein